MLDELRDAARVLESARLLSPVLGSVVRSSVSVISQALVEEGELAQALGQRVVVELGDGEDVVVGQEVDLGAALLATAPSSRSLVIGAPLRVVLLPGEAVAPDLDVQLARESALTQLTPTPCSPPETL